MVAKQVSASSTSTTQKCPRVHVLRDSQIVRRTSISIFFSDTVDFSKSRTRRSPFFGGTSFKFWRRCCFLRSRLAWIQEGWVLWQLKLRCISQPAARYSLSNLWYGRGAVSLPFSPSKNPSLTRIYQGAQSYHPKVTVDALSVRRIFSF